jgi:hypothetical protein
VVGAVRFRFACSGSNTGRPRPGRCSGYVVPPRQLRVAALVPGSDVLVHRRASMKESRSPIAYPTARHPRRMKRGPLPNRRIFSRVDAVRPRYWAASGVRRTRGCIGSSCIAQENDASFAESIKKDSDNLVSEKSGIRIGSHNRVWFSYSFS